MLWGKGVLPVIIYKYTNEGEKGPGIQRPRISQQQASYFFTLI